MNDDLKKLMELLKDQALSNSVRLGILLSLYVLGKTTFAELQKTFEIPKSSLYVHLQILKDNGLIDIKKVITLSGPRTVIEITDKGMEVVKKYLDVIKKF
ncbi:transcriptional regulator [Saccharolobus caldissimus]|uniref:Transcriptional regulator n=1 Tax=Saccharolobus caldissimus TaxID=1702097 RepID=A0AAQ4CR27_9CREN|nr:transcriptional regulator [Saccharolobus caldissimus]BDB98258.1 transcriptional regulator [Saccharolobus caldissimus]